MVCLLFLSLRRLGGHRGNPVCARVTLAQVFSNTSSDPTIRAKYVFPVPAQAAVCAFEMRTEDGRVITGTAKEKRKAAEEHEKAARQGRMTGLVEWATDDGNYRFLGLSNCSTYLRFTLVFTISLGCLPEGQRVTTTVTVRTNL